MQIGVKEFIDLTTGLKSSVQVVDDGAFEEFLDIDGRLVAHAFHSDFGVSDYFKAIQDIRK